MKEGYTSGQECKQYSSKSKKYTDLDLDLDLDL